MRWRRIKAFIIRDLKAVFREKATLFWVILWPIIWIFMVAYVFLPTGIGEPVTLNLGVVNLDKSDAPFNGSMFIEIMNETEYKGVKLFNIKLYDNEDLLKTDLRKGRLDVGMVIPDGFGYNISYGMARIKIYIGADSPYTSQINHGIISGFMEGFRQRFTEYRINYTLTIIGNYTMGNWTSYIPENVSTPWTIQNISFLEFLRQYFMGLANPVNASYEEVKPEALRNRSTIIGWYSIGAIGMMFLYTGFSIGALMVVEEKERGTLRRILASPATESDLLVGKTLSGILLLGISALIAIIVAVALCGAKILWNPFNPVHWLVVPLMIATSLMTIGIGILLSLVAKTSRGASGLATALGLMLAFTAGIWFPKEWLPGWMTLLAEYFPVTWGIDAIRNILVFNLSLDELAPDLVKVLVATIVLYLLGVIAYKKTIRKYVES